MGRERSHRGGKGPTPKLSLVLVFLPQGSDPGYLSVGRDTGGLGLGDLAEEKGTELLVPEAGVPLR